MTKSAYCLVISVAFSLGSFAISANGQEQIPRETRPRIVDVRLSISGQSPQSPILKHRLLPQASDQIPGNAALLYYRAAFMSQQVRTKLDDGGATLAKIKTWRDLPPEELPLDKVQEKIAPFENALAELTMAARRDSCDWGLPLQESGDGVIDLTFMDLPEFRDLTSVLALRIRQKIAQNDFDGALADIQAGYTLAANLGEGETTLIHALVGYAITGIIDEQVMALLAMPDCPNLYWAFTNLPKRRVPLEGALKFERGMVYALFPEVLEARRTEHNIAEYWQQRLQAVIDRQQAAYAADNGGEKLPFYETLVASQAPRIKIELAEKYGYDPLALSKMTWNKAVLLYSGLEYERIWDHSSAPLGLSYHEAKPFYQQNPLEDRDGMLQGDPFLIAELYMPSFQQLHKAVATAQLRVELMRTVEAIRDYIAREEKLPDALSQISILPLPVNPLNGEPLFYELQEDGNAILKGTSVGGSNEYHLEIVLRET